VGDYGTLHQKCARAIMWVGAPSYSQIIWARNCDVFGQSGLCSRVITDRYREILTLVRQHGAKQEALAALREFNYDRLGTECGFSGDQWNSFIQTARSGNVYGLMADFVEGTSRLVDGLEQPRAYFAAGRMPPLSSFGQLMSEWQKVIAHGYQSAQVFQNLGLPRPRRF